MCGLVVVGLELVGWDRLERVGWSSVPRGMLGALLKVGRVGGRAVLVKRNGVGSLMGVGRVGGRAV